MMVSDEWYTKNGEDRDVVISSRLVLSRNLANFPFPTKMQNAEGERVKAIILDAFDQLENAESYHYGPLKKMPRELIKDFDDKGVLEESDIGETSEFVARNDGKVYCTINIKDHLRIVVLAPGLDFALSEGRYIDAGLQKNVQFAASYDFGYLTSSLYDAGSGMKLSCRLHLPALTLLGRIASISDSISKKGFAFTATYGLGSKGSSLGAFYTVTSLNSRAGTEFDQTASMQAAVKQVAEQERIAREMCLTQSPTLVNDMAYRSYALANYGMLFNQKEAIEIISGLKFGLEEKILEGSALKLNTLLFRVNDAHLEFEFNGKKTDLESDVSDDLIKRNDRLRAILLKESVSDIVMA